MNVRGTEQLSSDGRVSTILQAVVRKELHIKALIKDIQDVVEDEKDLDRIHRQVQKTINEIRNALEELGSLAREQDRETEREAVNLKIREHSEQVSSLQQCLRRANLSAQLAIEKTDRMSLLSRDVGAGSTEDSSSATRQRLPYKDKDNLAKMSSRVTDDLLSISRSLSGQVKLSEDALHTLVSSTKVISDTQEEFKAMGGVIHQSRKLLSKYNRREFTDKVLIFLALVFFFACALYVLIKRALSLIHI